MLTVGHPGRMLGAALVSLVLSVPALAGEPPARTVIRGISVVDVEGGRVLPGRTVVIEGGVITRIVEGNDGAVDGDSAVIDGTGLYLMPGLFDAHVHYVSPETFGPLMIANGVTFVRELGNMTETVLPLRDRLNRGEVLGPRMVATGAIVDGVPPVWPFSEACDTEEEARAAVRKLHGAGVDQIKVYSRLKPEVYRAAVDEARALGLKAVGHIPNACTVDDAVAAGQSGVEHFSRLESMVAKLVPAEVAARARLGGSGGGFSQMRAWAFLEQVEPAALAAELKKLADAGMVQCPTVVVMAGIGESADAEAAAKNPLLAYVPTELRTFWGGESYANWAATAAQLVGPMQRMVMAMHEAGVPLIVGTDLANPYVFAGFGVHTEMGLWAEAGVPTADILRAATITPATFCGVGDRYGSVAEGKGASLVLLEASPLEDIANAQKIRAVILDGRVFDRAELDAMLEGVREVVRAGAPAAAGVEVDMSVPGEVIARGRYKLKFGQFDAGVEDFVVSRDADGGYHLKAHSQPKGGPQKPAVVTVRTGADFAFVSGGYRELTTKPLVVAYTLAGGRVEARELTADGEAGPAQGVELPGEWVFAAPVFASDYLMLRHTALEPGETRAMTAVGFGWNQPTWHLGATPMELTRHPDALLARGGATVQARRYTSTLTTPMGALKGEVWTDAEGVPLRSVVTLPFGSLTVELE